MTRTDPVPQDLVDRFAAEHFLVNSITPDRQRRVRDSLERLQVFTGKPLVQTTPDDLRGWLVALTEQGLAPSTIGWRLKAVRPFFQWAWSAGLIDAEQMMRLRTVKPPRGSNTSMPRPYSRKELAHLWQRLDEVYPLANEKRIRRLERGTMKFRGPLRRHAMRLQVEAIIELALVCGLRRAEIYRLSIDDCHFDNHYITVHGKRVDHHDKVRDVPYPDSTREAITKWLRFRALLSPEHSGPWLSITGPNYAAPLSWERLCRILKPLGDWQLHRLRHTCATERLRADMEIEKLQRFLGHANISMTLRYAQLVRGDIHKASERTDAKFQRAIKPRAA